MNAPECKYCAGEPESGWIETINNGPIVPCPHCNPMTDREIEFELACAQRAANALRGKSLLARPVIYSALGGRHDHP